MYVRLILGHRNLAKEKMAKILFALSGDTYVRNYLRTGIIRDLSREHDVFLIAPGNLALRNDIAGSPNFLGFFDVTDDQTLHHHAAFNLLMWRHRKKSRTFLYRWMRNSKWSDVAGNPGVLPTVRSFLGWIIFSIRDSRWVLLPITGSRLLFKFFLRRAVSKIQPNVSLETLVRAQHWDVIVFPSAAFDPTSVELTKLGKQLGASTLCLIDNWDNLSSKTVFWEKPDYLGVWGEQSREQAVEIHGFAQENVHLVGTPRFDPYFQLRHEHPPSPYPFPYLLFVGAAMPFDEIAALSELEQVLVDLGPQFDDLKVVYRPHPWQQKRKTTATFDQESFPRTILDEQIKKAYLSGIQPETTTGSFQPDLDYYPALLTNARMVVGPLTTMLLEAALCLRPVVSLAYPDGVHFNPVRGYFTHFDGVEKIPGFMVCHSKNMLRSLTESALAAEPISAALSDQLTSHFVRRPPDGYGTNLSALLGDIYKSRHLSPEEPMRPKI